MALIPTAPILPATDEQIADIRKHSSDCNSTGRERLELVARIDQERARAEVAERHAYGGDGMARQRGWADPKAHRELVAEVERLRKQNVSAQDRLERLLMAYDGAGTCHEWYSDVQGVIELLLAKPKAEGVQP